MEPTLSLQIVSDLHIELLKRPLIWGPVTAPYLALLGDIGRPHKETYRQLIQTVSGLYREVFVIAGNHEYYHEGTHPTHGYKRTMDEHNREITKVCRKYSNVHFLNRTRYDLGEYRILGVTLWSAVPSDLAKYAREMIADYSRIYTQDGETKRLITPAETTQLHQQDRAWLERELSESTKKTIVLTHHAPLLDQTSAPIHRGDPMQCAFATDLSALVKPPVVLWAFGHTHWKTDLTHNGVRVVSNPKGYTDEETDFNWGQVYSLE